MQAGTWWSVKASPSDIPPASSSWAAATLRRASCGRSCSTGVGDRDPAWRGSQTILLCYAKCQHCSMRGIRIPPLYTAAVHGHNFELSSCTQRLCMATI
eukprot:162555-Chlamydomonas_euryale.AAC.1